MLNSINLLKFVWTETHLPYRRESLLGFQFHYFTYTNWLTLSSAYY